MSKDEQRGYASSPYNFIPFFDEVFEAYSSIENLPEHNKFCKGTMTGYIDYKINTETPIFISDGSGEFFKVNDKYVIPGSTIRGKVRNNSEIITCSYPEFIEYKKFWYRGIFDETDDPKSKLYKNELFPQKGSKISDRVKAGYLMRKGENYFIIPCQEDANGKSYREIHESKLRRSYSKIDQNIRNNIFMYNNKSDNNELLWDRFKKIKQDKRNLQQKLYKLSFGRDDKFINKNSECKILKQEIHEKQKGINDLLENNKNPQYKYYCYKIRYEIHQKSNELIIHKLSENSKNNKQGFLMNSTNPDKKQNHYLILGEDKGKCKKLIPSSVINSYMTSIQFRHGEDNKMVDIKKDDTLKANKKRPVFYIMDDNGEIIVFGFTPYLKIPYEQSVSDLINLGREEGNKIDFVKSVFGFTNLNQKSYKGRVSFTNAILQNNICKKGETHKYLMSPRPTSFQLYVKQEKNELGEIKTYTKGSKLRGRKFYWIKAQCDQKDQFKKSGNTDNKKQLTQIRALDKGAIFAGRIYFENLYEYELGLLLMAIKPCQNARDNIGQGKPYGYGKISFSIEKIILEDMESKFIKFNSGKEKTTELGIKISNIKEQIAFLEEQMEKVYNQYEGEQRKEFIENILKYIKSDFYDQFIYTKTVEKNSSVEFKYMDFKLDKTKYRKRWILKSLEQYKKGEQNDTAEEEVAADREINNEDLMRELSLKFKVSSKRK